MGCFGKLGDEGIDLWTTLPDAFQAGSGAAAFDLLVNPVRNSFLPNWGAGYFRKSARGPIWDISGPSIPPADSTPTGNVAWTVAPGETRSFASLAYPADIADVRTPAEIIEISLDGFGRAGDDAGG